MNIDSKLDMLKQINAVAAPPFLLTRIRQQIQSGLHLEAPVKWKWVFALTSIVILALNISILFRSAGTNDKSGKVADPVLIETVISSMNLSTDNDLYHD